MRTKFTILKKGLLLIAAPLLVYLLFLGALFLQSRQLESAGRWALHTKEVIRQGQTVLANLTQLDSGLRGLVAAGADDATSRENYEHARQRLPKEVRELLDLIRDNRSQSARGRGLAEQIQRYAETLQGVRQRVDTGDQAGAVAVLRELSDQPSVKKLYADLNAFLNQEDQLDTRRLSVLRQTSHHQDLLLLTGLLFGLGAGVATALVFGRDFGRRLAVLTENVRRLSAGEALVPRVAGSDEISVLDDQFHRMADSLVATAAQERTYKADLERRTAELIESNRELDQKNQENEMFVYSVSHDLRSPLVNLQGFGRELGFAMEDLKKLLADPALPDHVRARGRELIEQGVEEPIHFIRTAVTRLSTIIDALLRLSRVGRVDYQVKEIDVPATVARVVGALRSSLSQKGAKITVRPLCPVWGDPAAVEQVFANLLGNAVNYLDKNRPGQIEVGLADDLAADHDGQPVLPMNQVTFYVKDNGLGIPELFRSKIFLVFQRLHGSVAPGEGIGLALVRRVIERHGGRIWVESTEGVGSTFFFSLPARPWGEEAAAAAAAAALEAPEGQTVESVEVRPPRDPVAPSSAPESAPAPADPARAPVVVASR